MVKVKEETCSVEDGAVFLVLPSGGGGEIHNNKLQ